MSLLALTDAQISTWVASFMLPTLAPRCEAAFPGYTARTSPAFLRWLASNQEQIERGRLLTMSEMKMMISLMLLKVQMMKIWKMMIFNI